MKTQLIAFILLYSVSACDLFAQDNSLFPIVYFKHKAQNNAVITAKYSELAHNYAKNALFNEKKFNSNIDTAFYFVTKAIYAVDSTRIHATDSITRDSTRIALFYLSKTKIELLKTKEYLKLAYHYKNLTNAEYYAEKAVYSSGNAVSNAYMCSIFFNKVNSLDNNPETSEQYKKDCDCDCDSKNKIVNSDNNNQQDNNKVNTNETVENAVNSAQLTDIPKQETTPNEVKRIEVDEATLTSIKKMYEERMMSLQAKIDSLKEVLKNTTDEKEKLHIQSEIDKLETDKKMLSGKHDGAEEKLKNIRTELDNYYSENGQRDKSTSINKPIFAFDKDGFYNDINPIPMDQKLPDGLIYSVQLGVYSKLAMPEWFKGLYPLDGQTVSAEKFRYRTGVFYSYDQATEIKNKIWDIGLRDAFIIAFNNGEIISVSKAVRMKK